MSSIFSVSKFLSKTRGKAKPKPQSQRAKSPIGLSDSVYFSTDDENGSEKEKLKETKEKATEKPSIFSIASPDADTDTYAEGVDNFASSALSDFQMFSSVTTNADATGPGMGIRLIPAQSFDAITLSMPDIPADRRFTTNQENLKPSLFAGLTAEPVAHLSLADSMEFISPSPPTNNAVPVNTRNVHAQVRDNVWKGDGDDIKEEAKEDHYTMVLGQQPSAGLSFEWTHLDVAKANEERVKEEQETKRDSNLNSNAADSEFSMLDVDNRVPELESNIGKEDCDDQTKNDTLKNEENMLPLNVADVLTLDEHGEVEHSDDISSVEMEHLEGNIMKEALFNGQPPSYSPSVDDDVRTASEDLANDSEVSTEKERTLDELIACTDDTPADPFACSQSELRILSKAIVNLRQENSELVLARSGADAALQEELHQLKEALAAERVESQEERQELENEKRALSKSVEAGQRTIEYLEGRLLDVESEEVSRLNGIIETERMEHEAKLQEEVRHLIEKANRKDKRINDLEILLSKLKVIAAEKMEQDEKMQEIEEQNRLLTEILSGKQKLLDDFEAQLKKTKDVVGGFERTDFEAKIRVIENQKQFLTERMAEKQTQIDNLQTQFANKELEVVKLNDSIANLNKVLEERRISMVPLEKALERKALEVTRLKEDRRKMESEYKASLIRWEEEALKQKVHVEEKARHIQMAEMNNENLTAQLLRLQRQMNSFEKQNRMLVGQLREQSNELQSVLNAKDTSSSSAPSPATPPNAGRRMLRNGGATAGPNRTERVIKMLQQLNEEVCHSAALMADRVAELGEMKTGADNESTRFVISAPTAPPPEMVELLKPILGIELINLLKNEEMNPFLLQNAFQGCLNACCAQIITSWYPTEWDYGNFLAAMYERIRGKNGIEMAAHWRKLTQPFCIDVKSTDRSKALVAFIAKRIQTVLTISRLSSPSEKNPKMSLAKNMATASEMFVEEFSQKLADVVALSLNLNLLTTSGGIRVLEPLFIEAGELFNSRQMTNDNLDPEDYESSDAESDKKDSEKRKGSPKVVCNTVALGVKFVDDASIDDVQVVEGRILLKPRVLLDQTLDICKYP